MLLYLFYTVHVLICIFLILVVLLQQGSGADLSVFGGGATQTAFGARSATNLLHRLTVAGFVGFIVTTIGIGFIKMSGPVGSVMGDVPAATAEAPIDEATTTSVEAAPATTLEASPEGAELLPADEPLDAAEDVENAPPPAEDPPVS